MSLQTRRIHGGPDALGAAQFDFSTNSNACGPCPSVVTAITQADTTRYPDASYTKLRAQLAVFHAVDVQRIVLAASASEFIFRVTAMVARRGGRTVGLPPFCYGDYAHAAAAYGLKVAEPQLANLLWACEPSSPLGQLHANWQSSPAAVRVLDLAYEPLRLEGQLSLPQPELNNVWQLYSPNKALGLTGVRAAYAIAPVDSEPDVETMNQLCPSWPIGAHGAAMLEAWTQADTQAWLAGSLDTLRHWKAEQTALCASFGWTVMPSLANFFVCRADVDIAALRQHSIKLRDCASFGLPDHVRLGVLGPAAQDALKVALQI